jgi:hypothetical protein
MAQLAWYVHLIQVKADIYANYCSCFAYLRGSVIVPTYVGYNSPWLHAEREARRRVPYPVITTLALSVIPG